MTGRNRGWRYVALGAGVAIGLVVGLLAPVPTWAQQDARGLDFNAIVRSLAPIEYLPEHGGRLRSLDLEVRFAVDSAEISPDAAWQLEQLVLALRDSRLAGQRFMIAGHTDASGDAAHNKRLSLRRAAAVKRHLAEKGHIDPARLDVEGWGEERLKDPVNPTSTVNRRVEVTTLGPATDAAPGRTAVPAPTADSDVLRGILRGDGNAGAAEPKR